MNTQNGIITVYQAGFPASQINKTVEYSLIELDSTGSPTIIQNWTSTDVIEVGQGAYTVKLTLSEGRYSILWRIVGTPYKASEEINVMQNIYDEIDSLSNLVTSSMGIYNGFGS
jgi:polysaccharide pyruvyl transferase WcaK-like protein